MFSILLRLKSWQHTWLGIHVEFHYLEHLLLQINSSFQFWALFLPQKLFYFSQITPWTNICTRLSVSTKGYCFEKANIGKINLVIALEYLFNCIAAKFWSWKSFEFVLLIQALLYHVWQSGTGFNHVWSWIIEQLYSNWHCC